MFWFLNNELFLPSLADNAHDIPLSLENPMLYHLASRRFENIGEFGKGKPMIIPRKCPDFYIEVAIPSMTLLVALLSEEIPVRHIDPPSGREELLGTREYRDTIFSSLQMMKWGKEQYRPESQRILHR